MVDEQPFLFSLSEYKSSDPQRGLAFMPKRYLNVSECEIARVYKVHTDRVEPISFKVPRKVRGDCVMCVFIQVRYQYLCVRVVGTIPSGYLPGYRWRSTIFDGATMV